MSNVILVLQKVTTFPIETIDFTPEKLMDISYGDIHEYYSNIIRHKDPIKPITAAPAPGAPGAPAPGAAAGAGNSPDAGNSPGANGTVTEEDMRKHKSNDLIQSRFIVYNAVFDKLLANSLNLLPRDPNNIKTLVVFPTYDQLDNGKIELKKQALDFYSDKFNNITRQILSFDKKNNIGYYGLPVFRSEKNDEYKKAIKDEFDEIKRLLVEYNNEVTKKTPFARSDTSDLNQIKQILFIIDIDKKSLFTGFYNKSLSKEKQEILNKEYYNFLSSSIFRRKNVDDAGINLLYTSVKKEMDRFNTLTATAITKKLKEDDFNHFISILREGYKKNTDAEYKKSIELKDNIKEFKIYYILDIADKVIEDKIETGSNKLYYIYLDTNKNTKQHIIGSFTVSSKERNIYRFQEDKKSYNRRTGITGHNENNTNDSSSSTPGPAPAPPSAPDSSSASVTNTTRIKLPSEKIDVAIQITLNYRTFTYKILNDDPSFNSIKTGTITPYRDKKEKKYKWFNIRDIDESLLNKDTIKYYSDILFDKKTLIEYLKSKEKYTNKTRLSYEFLKINDTPELSEYCDFIYKNFKSNINSLKRGLFGFDPFKINFNDDVIMKNILDIIFESNALIYVQNNRAIKEEARKESRTGYKIVKYKMDDTFEDETCKEYTDIFLSNDLYKTKKVENDKINICKKEYDDTKNNNPKKKFKSVIIVVSKLNIKDADLLKSTVECKTKANKIKYDYNQLVSNVTKRVGLVGGTKNKKIKKNTRYKNTKIISKRSRRRSKRRLKAKRYK
jgi:hypothetical protein